MENLVNKWKKMMNNEKEKFERSEISERSESNNKNSPRKKSTERNFDFNNQDKYLNNEKERERELSYKKYSHNHTLSLNSPQALNKPHLNLTSSLMSNKSDRSNKFKISKSNSNRTSTDNLLIRSNSSQQKLAESAQFNNQNRLKNSSQNADLFNVGIKSPSSPKGQEYDDKLVTILNKTLNYINKNFENSNFNINKVIENLNECVEIQIQNLGNRKLNNRKIEEKEIIWHTKCDTAEKIVKDLELKILTAEKEKVNLLVFKVNLKIKFKFCRQN